MAGTVVWASLLLVFAVAAVLVAFENAMHFTGSAIDGPFQLYNGLRRIAAGFRPGVDFQYFHGLGIPYAHYWIFRAFGAGLRGSQLARELFTAVAYPIVLVVFFRAFTGDVRRAFCLAAAAFAVTFALKLSAIVFALNGMLGLRAALPTLLPAVAFLSPSRRIRGVAVGVALGLAMFMSTEQGLAALAAYIIVSAFAVARRTDRAAQLAEAVGSIALAAVTLVVCLTLVGGVPGMRGAMRYNFTLVPMDQYWYFGAPPNHFIPSLDSVVPMLGGAPFIGGAVLLVVIATVVYLRRFWFAADGDAGQRTFALALLPVYGLISCASLLGVFTGAYAQPCWRVLVLIGLLELSAFFDRKDVQAGRDGLLGVSRGLAVASLAMSAVTIGAVQLVPAAYVSLAPHLVREHIRGGLGFSIDEIWPETLREAQRAIDSHRGPKGELPTLWSTYAGWIEARNGMFHPSFDYIIHALGPDNREGYVERFRVMKPALVQTVDPEYTQYEGWLENNSWAFYDELLRWYIVSSGTPWSLFWERRATPAPEPLVIGTMAIPAGMTSVQLPPIPERLRSPTMVLDVVLEYETLNPLHWLPIIGASPRYLVGVSGALRDVPISLNPYVRRMQFPLFVNPAQPVTLSFQTFSLLPGAEFTPKTISVAVRFIDPRNTAWLSVIAKPRSSE